MAASEYLNFNDPDYSMLLNCYLFLGTPFDTPCGISNAGSVTDLKKPENHTPNSGVETPDETQLYALEGTPGCFSRTDSVENLDEHIEKGQKEAAEGPSEKGMLNKSIVDHVCIESLLETCSCLPKKHIDFESRQRWLNLRNCFHFGSNLPKQKMPNQYSEHLLFRWIVLRIVILAIGAKLENIYEIEPPLLNGK